MRTPFLMLQGGVKYQKGKLPKISNFVITLFAFLHCLSPGLFGFCRIRILRSRRHCRIAAIEDFCLDDSSNFLRIWKLKSCRLLIAEVTYLSIISVSAPVGFS